LGEPILKIKTCQEVKESGNITPYDSLSEDANECKEIA
jgi:hypothetical protein